MRHFFRRKSSCQIAKDRLKILLISDRVNCSPEVMELIKMDIAKVLSNRGRHGQGSGKIGRIGARKNEGTNNA